MRHFNRISLFIIFALLAISMVMPASAQDDIIVTTIADNGEGSFREAILTANDNGGGTIRFMIDAPRPYVMELETALPEITVPIVIDGESECATDTTASKMRVVIDGSGVPFGDGLYLTDEADGSVIKGLSIGGFVDGLGLFIGGAENVIVTCNHIGVDALGTEATPNDKGIYSTGMGVSIGTLGDVSGRNIISGNIGY
nr:hypothetical protein [Anaerolineae bacterium]